MKPQFLTKLNELSISDEAQEFWNDDITSKHSKLNNRYSLFGNDKKLSSWNTLLKNDDNLFNLFEHVSKLYQLEKNPNSSFHDSYSEPNKDNSFISLQFLDILSKDNIDITSIIINTKKEDPENKQGWYFSHLFELYIHSLKNKNKFIDLDLLNYFLDEIKINKQKFSNNLVDYEIATYFNLLEIIPQKHITQKWFSEHLELFSLMTDYNTQKVMSYAEYLNYDSQKKIYDYVNIHFPKNINDYSKYYSNILNVDIFSTEQLYQSSIKINLIQLLHKYNLEHKDFAHLTNIAKECLNVVASEKFMKLINKNINVSHILTKGINNDNYIQLFFSTDTPEKLNDFQQILLTSLHGVFEVSKKINLTWSESYSGADELITNMDAKFIYQHYLYHTLNQSLNNDVKTNKKPKI